MSDNPLLEVRKAYRLLFDYQSRILDLMKFIEQTYNIPFFKGYPKFSGRGSNNLTNSSWDWLNMYYYAFHYSSELKKPEPKIYLSVFLLNDSGFFQAKVKDKNISKFNLSKYDKPENSKTKLIFAAGKDKWTWWEKIKINGILFTLQEEGKSEDNHMVWKSYDLELFFTENQALIQLQDFSKFCTENDIPVTIENK
ncbi:hypothetical protein [Cellulophaga baltica]|uniref:hypothetical protein n=1 Tax=Cellulophaga baltica TaxID=76594 RepID=UPI00040324FC|nr:hypothetical protein [Cellulophaga baltica]AIY12558.1 hypothetical protein M667_04710 [Cellulophaga baltica NN016038]